MVNFWVFIVLVTDHHHAFIFYLLNNILYYHMTLFDILSFLHMISIQGIIKAFVNGIRGTSVNSSRRLSGVWFFKFRTIARNAIIFKTAQPIQLFNYLFFVNNFLLKRIIIIMLSISSLGRIEVEIYDCITNFCCRIPPEILWYLKFLT